MNIQLNNDVLRGYGIHVVNNAGIVVPAQAGDTFTASSSSPTQLNVAIGTLNDGTPAVFLNALVPNATGIGFTVTDADGLTAFQGMVDIVTDNTPTAVTLDLAHPQDTPQPVPATPAPAATVPGATAAAPKAPGAV